MSSLEALLERSRKPGAYLERKRFTLSREKAVEKQRAYALRNETQYILELVQAAVLAGASFIAIDIKPETILVAFIGGRLIQEQELQSILDYLFADRGDPKLRHLVQLAIGINALLQRGPKVIRMESGDGQQAVRLELDTKGNGEMGQPAEPISGTYLLMERELSFWESLKRAPSVTEEEKLVAIACSHTPVPIIINGKAPFGYTAKREIKLFGIPKQHFFDRDQVRGVLAVDERPDAVPRFRVVIGGCIIVELELPELGTVPQVGGGSGVFYGVVCDDRLRKTADQGDVVRDARLTRTLRVLQEEARGFALQSYGVAAKQVPIPPAPEGEDSEADSEAPAMAPLGDTLACLGPLGTVPLAELEEHPERAVFWVDPLDRERLASVADPAVFPFHVLILEEPELRSLLVAIPSLALQRLSSAADVAFVTRGAEAGHAQWAVSLAVDEPGLQGTLVLRAHGDSAPPPWGQPGQVPVCVCQGDRAQVLTGLSLPFVGVSARLETVRPVDAGELAWLGSLTRVVQSELWRLLLRCPPEPAWSRRLSAGLLGAQARPRFERLADHRVQVHAALPPEWGAEGRALGARPLDGSGWTLERVVALWNGGGSAQASEGLLEPLAPFLEALGGGRLHGAESRALLALSLGAELDGGQAHSWRPLAEVRDPIARVVLCADPAPLPLPEGWQQRVGPIPRVRLLWTGQAPQGDAPFRALLEAWGADAAFGELGARLALSQALGVAVDPEAVSSDGRIRRPLSQWVADPALRVSAFGGVALREPSTVPMQIDLLRTLEATLGAPLTLRFDDAPEVWESLLAPPEQGGWLLREPLQVPGLRGWLGLRLPYDGTGGVLVRDPDGGWLAMPELDARLPCHGLVWITDSRPVLSASQEELMALCALQMYQRLAEGVRARGFGAHLEDARKYAMRFCWLCAQQGRAHLGTVRLLAGAVVLEGEDGRRWGTLDAWLDAPEDSRPALPIALPALGQPLSGAEGMAPEGGLVAVIKGLVDQVDRGIQMSVQLTEVASPAAVVRSGGERLHLQLNTRLELVRAALGQEGLERELVAMEAARQIAIWCRERGIGLGLGELQQVLLARKLRL